MSYLKNSVKCLIISVFTYFIIFYENEEEQFWKLPIDERLIIQLYPVERHFIITEDKYNITLFRVGKKGSHKINAGRPIVFIP